MRPFVDDVESFTLVDASGKIHACSRSRNSELFRLTAGGYGLFRIRARDGKVEAHAEAGYAPQTEDQPLSFGEVSQPQCVPTQSVVHARQMDLVADLLIQRQDGGVQFSR